MSGIDESYTLGYGDGAMAWMKSRTVEGHGAFLLPYLSPGMSLLDCGCGPASLTLGYAERLAPGQVVGIDREPEQFEAALEHAAGTGITNLRLEVGDIYALPFEDAVFDVAFCSAVLGSVSEPGRVVGEMVRVLKPGGVIALKEFDHGGDIMYPQPPLIEKSIELYHRLREHNRHGQNAGRRVKEYIHESGCSIEYANAVYEQQTEREGLRAYIARNELLIDEILAPQYLALGWVTQEELAAQTDAWRKFAEDPAAIYVSSWIEAVGRK